MTGAAADDKANSGNERGASPYAPSWVDRFTAWVARLPGPSWSFYLGLGLVLLFVQAIVLWVEGAFPVGRVDPAHAFLAAAIPLLLGLIHFLDDRAGTVLAGMRPALKTTEKEHADLSYRLTTLPAVPTLLAGLAALGCAFMLEIPGGPYRLEALDSFPVSATLLRFVFLICWWAFGTLLYHTVHQLRLINHIYTQHTHINLFRMQSLYALSNLTALTAGGLAVVPYAFLYANRATELLREAPIVLSFYLMVTFLAVVTFVWPQLGIHRLQIEEKERLLDEANQRFEAAIVDLHQRVDSGKLEGMVDMHRAMAGLEIERSALEKIPTWPWEPEVVRLLITALALPLGLWLIQFILQRVLGS
jgi:hypothetical protein